MHTIIIIILYKPVITHYKYYVIACVTSPYLFLVLSSEAVMSNFCEYNFYYNFGVSFCNVMRMYVL